MTLEILTFETIYSTEWQSGQFQPFNPTVFINISHLIERQMQAVAAYRAEMRPPLHCRCDEHIQALARHRGLSVGYEYAEASCLLRRLES